ncbi:MAG: aminotransferase class V-fold PLP-dependent enzyme [Christensenellaceae bacterium]|nr:aminotransferase class V-fold PLP-dependent enzyme [Christensenellaceae bacterium]
MLYLDNAATTFPKPPEVVRAVEETMLYAGANPGRAGHRLSLAAGRVVDKTRRSLASFLQVSNPENLVFGLNCTDMLNTAIFGAVQRGWEVASTVWEHNSVLRPLHYLQAEGVIKLRLAPTIEQAITRRTKMVVLTHASNVTGLIQPIEAVAELCRMRGILFIVDAAQTAGILPLFPENWGIDMVAMPGHKGLYGPQGTGALYIREGLHLQPARHGGTGTSSAQVLQPNERPERYEAGTLNTPGLAGLGAGVEYVIENRAKIYANELLMVKRLLIGLCSMDRVTVYGSPEAHARVGTVSFNIRGLGSQEVADGLDEFGICVRGGLHCAPLTHQSLGTAEQGAVRVSLGAFNGFSDVEQLLDAVKFIAAKA